MGKAADVSHFLYEVLVAHPIIDKGHHHLQGKNESNDYRTQKNVRQSKNNLCSSTAAFQTDKMRVLIKILNSTLGYVRY